MMHPLIVQMMLNPLVLAVGGWVNERLGFTEFRVNVGELANLRGVADRVHPLSGELVSVFQEKRMTGSVQLSFGGSDSF